LSFLTKLPAELYRPDAFKQFSGGTEFEIGNARAMAWMSQLAYETDEPEKIAKILQSFGLALVEGGVLVKESKTVLPKASTHCFAASHPMAVIVAFASTDPLSLANWISDFDAHLEVTTGTAEGYEDAADVVWSGLKQLLERCVPPGGKVFVTGHSLGGALAALIANRIGTELQADVDAVYTFGMPRPGSKAFADLYNRQLGMRTIGWCTAKISCRPSHPLRLVSGILGWFCTANDRAGLIKPIWPPIRVRTFPPSSAALPRTSGIIYMGRFPRCCRSRRGSNWPRRS
jgi:hypothetical protein